MLTLKSHETPHIVAYHGELYLLGITPGAVRGRQLAVVLIEDEQAVMTQIRAWRAACPGITGRNALDAFDVAADYLVDA